ncbi:MAG: hypothetical protein E7454_02270 [Ruminococcaceae bacterium]|nr:hypothetical protein [Oscillospiraceae bacterium]
MENEHNESIRRVTRQSWKPSKPVRVLHGTWKVVYTFIKVILGALATVLAIGAICAFVFMGLLADYLGSDQMAQNSEVVMGDFDQSGNSVMYYRDADGNIQVLQRLHADTDKDWATFEEIPEDLIYATVAIEDHRFFEHQGVDWIPTIRACISMFVGGREFGGSSITQQLIKNLYLEYDETADDVTVQRKVLEIFRATEFEKRYDKEFILEWYLNKIYLGERCKGIKPAAAEYFGKELEDLNTAECAALISITNNPSLFNPYREGLDDYKGEQLTGMERNKRRREDTLYMMKEYGWLTEEAYAQALIDSENLTLKRGIDEEDRYSDCVNENCGYHGKLGTFIVKEDGKTYCPKCLQSTTVDNDASKEVYSWFVDVVLEEVAQYYCERGGVDWEHTDVDARNDFKRLVCQSGLHIYTTLDMTVQKQVDKIYTNLDEIPDTDSIQQLQSGMVVIDNATGDIVAIAGGVGEKDVHDAYSKATDAKLQPGSSIKPLTVYAPSFELGVLNPASVVKDLPLYYVENNPFPRNSDRKYSLKCTILDAVIDSVNASAVNSLDIMGREYSFNFAKDKFQLSTLVREYVNSSGKVFTDIDWAPLGMGAPTVGITVRDMSAAYATFANNGTYRDARTYTLIYDNDGNLIHNNEQKSSQILSPKTVDYVNYCLDNAVESGTGRYAEFKSYDYDICGKTGTTTSAKDRWFCGYTSQYTAAVWTGYDHPEAITGVSGGNVACQLWRKVMEPLHKNLESKVMYNESNFVPVTVCLDCGKQATGACAMDVRTYEHGLSRIKEVLVYPEDVPQESCDCHVVVDYCATCKAAANTGCTNVVKRSLVKMTQSDVEEIIKASECGLETAYRSDNYIYLVDKKGNPVAFHGFKNDKNYGLELPYVSCHIHKPIPIFP